MIEDAVREDAGNGRGQGRERFTFHVLQENMVGFWSYRTDPKSSGEK